MTEPMISFTIYKEELNRIKEIKEKITKLEERKYIVRYESPIEPHYIEWSFGTDSTASFTAPDGATIKVEVLQND